MVTTTFLFLSLFIGAFLIAISVQNEVHLYPLTHTGPTSTKPLSYESAAQLAWEKSRIFRMGLRLVDENKDASYPVMVKIDDEYYPLCEDNFNDLTAQTLCEMYYYERGYRTTYTLDDDQEFSFTNLECYQDQLQLAHPSLNEDDYPYDQRDAFQTCNLRDYADKNSTRVFPCAKSQAAAVHCFDLQCGVTWTPQIYRSRISNKKWSITFTLDIFKFGKKITLFGRQGLEDFLNVSPDEIFAISCGKHSTPDVKYPKIGGQEYLRMSGKFSRACEGCQDLFIVDGMQHIWHFWRVCRDH